MPMRKERGAALPLVLVVTMVLVILVTDMGLRAQVSFDRSRRALHVAESRSLLRILEDRMANLGPNDIAALAAEERELHVDGYRVQIVMKTTESAINIKRLDDLLGGPTRELFAALLKREKLEARALPCALDWADADDDPHSWGAERLDYMGEDVSPRNAPFETVDELSFVRGFRDRSAFDRLRPNLTTFGSGRIYVPSMSDKLLEAFGDIYGVDVRNALDDMRRRPGRKLELRSNAISQTAMDSLKSILEEEIPTAWQVTVVLRGNHFYSKSEYVLIVGEPSAAGPNHMFRIA